MKKNIAFIGLAVGISVISTIPAFAFGWQKDNVGWWYGTNENNSIWYNSSWQWLDGNNDGIAECYYFNSDGYIAVNTTVDGCTVNNDGAWTVNGVVQTKQVSLKETSQKNVSGQEGGNGAEKDIYDVIDEYNRKQVEEWMKDMPPYPSGNGNYTGGGDIHF